MAQKCTLCNEPSLPGLARGSGKCRYHWAVGVWGKGWADKHVDTQYAEQLNS